MKTGNRKTAAFALLAGLLLLPSFGCQPQEDVIVYERDPTVDPETKAKRLMSSARQYLESELYPQAEEAYREILGLQPDSRTAHANLAYAVRAQGRADEALELYREYTNLFPDDADGFARLSAVYAERDEIEKAAEYAKKAVDVSPDDVDLLHGLGDYYIRLEKWEEAQAVYERAVKLDPENEDYPKLLARIYKELGKTEELLATQEERLAREPENKKLIAGVAKLNLDIENYARAAELYEKLAGLDEENTAVLKNLAIIRLRMADTTAAIGAYARVVQNDPSDADARIRLADYLSARSIARYDEAVRNVQAGLELDPLSAHGWCVWGKTLERQGKYKQAKQKYEKAAGLGDPYWSEYARKEAIRQAQLIEREKKKKEKEEYDKLDEL